MPTLPFVLVLYVEVYKSGNGKHKWATANLLKCELRFKFDNEMMNNNSTARNGAQSSWLEWFMSE